MNRMLTTALACAVAAFAAAPATAQMGMGGNSSGFGAGKQPEKKPQYVPGTKASEKIFPLDSTWTAVSLNGKPLQRTFLRHDEILAGGELRFSMQAEPNKDWPGQGAQAPYSMSR